MRLFKFGFYYESTVQSDPFKYKSVLRPYKVYMFIKMIRACVRIQPLRISHRTL